MYTSLRKLTWPGRQCCHRFPRDLIVNAGFDAEFILVSDIGSLRRGVRNEARRTNLHSEFVGPLVFSSVYTFLKTSQNTVF